MKTNPIQSQSKPILVSPQIFWGLKGDLKKQTQFAPELMGVTPFAKGDYDNMPANGEEENKAKQSQFPAPEPAKGAGKREESLAAATG